VVGEPRVAFGRGPGYHEGKEGQRKQYSTEESAERRKGERFNLVERGGYIRE